MVREARAKIRRGQEGGSSAGLIAAVAPLLGQREAPTAFITLRPRQALTWLAWLGSRGYRVPQDFSLISLAAAAIFAPIIPTITTHHIDPSVFARRVAKHLELLVDGQLGAQGSLLLMPDLVPGGPSLRDKRQKRRRQKTEDKRKIGEAYPLSAIHDLQSGRCGWKPPLRLPFSPRQMPVA